MSKLTNVGVKRAVYHPRVTACYDSLFNQEYPCGVKIVAGPRGAGKTTLLKMYCNEYIKRGGRAIYLSHDKITKNIRDFDYNDFISNFIRGTLLPGKHLAEYLPNKSVIVLDHIDGYYDGVNTLNTPNMDNLRILLLILMHEVPLYGNFNVVAAVSNPNLAREMLKLNNYCKIGLAFDPIVHKWDSYLLEDIIDSIFHEKEHEQKKDLIRLACMAGTPGFLTDFPICERKALQIENEWKEFSYESLLEY